MVGLAVDSYLEFTRSQVLGRSWLFSLLFNFNSKRFRLQLPCFPFLEKLQGNAWEKRIRKDVLNPFPFSAQFPRQLFELRFQQVCRSACDELLFPYGLLSDGLINRSRRFTIKPLEIVPGLTGYYLVSLAGKNVQGGLGTYNLGRWCNKRRVSKVLPDPRHLIEDILHSV